MRRILLAATAIALVGGGAAFAEGQQIYNPVTATTNTNNVDVSNGLQSQTQAVGNVLTVGSSVQTYVYPGNAGDTQSTDSHVDSISATSTLTNSTISGISSVSSLAEGNDMEINPSNTVSLKGAQATGTENEAATTSVGNASAGYGDVSFNGGATITAAAVGNNLTASSTSGTVGFGNVGWQSPPFDQTNGAGGAWQNNPTGAAATEAATVNLDNTDVAGGVLNSEAQAIGNSVSASGIVTAGSTLWQQNNAGQTATENLSGDNLLSSGAGNAGNVIVASAEGNVASLGQVTTGGVSQQNAAGQQAVTNLSNSTVNGEFTSQSAGNVLTLASNTGSTVSSQYDSAPSTADMNVSGPVVLNAATTFGSLAVGNQFTGTSSPGAVGLAFNASQADPTSGTTLWENQDNTGLVNANSTVSGVTSSGFAATVNTTAAGNLATMTSPGTFQQFDGQASTALASISGSTFGGGLTVATAALGNSISIK